MMINDRHLGSTSQSVKKLHYMTSYTARQKMGILCSVPFLDHEKQFPFDHAINPCFIMVIGLIGVQFSL